MPIRVRPSSFLQSRVFGNHTFSTSERVESTQGAVSRSIAPCCYRSVAYFWTRNATHTLMTNVNTADENSRAKVQLCRIMLSAIWDVGCSVFSGRVHISQDETAD
jgi:hypothetical protein